MIISTEIKDQNFEFHPVGAAFWKEEQMLLISDVHLGKISHFRKYGSAVPFKAIGRNFQQLSQVVKQFQPERICFLGDLFHSFINSEWLLFEDWVKDQSAEIILIAGNHDVISPLKYEELGVEVKEELTLKDFLLSHHPEERDDLYNICGHIHPGYRLIGRGRQVLKLPCFYKRQRQLILPAFGEFTGNYIVSPSAGEEIYAITKKEVILVYSEKQNYG